MAFGAKRIFPIDTKPGTGVGVAIPFNAPAVFRTTYTTKDAIRNNLINYFLTNKGERVFNPFFGANLRARLFEQITTGNSNSLRIQVENDLKTFFPLVSIQNLEVINNEDENSFNVKLTYNIINFGITDNINLEIQ